MPRTGDRGAADVTHRGMADSDLRAQQRFVATDADRARAALLRQRLRAGELDRAAVRDLAAVGDPGARELLGDEAPPVVGFVDAARRYCAWARSGDVDGGEVERLLAELVFEIQRVPNVEGDDGDGHPEVPHPEWAAVFRRMQAIRPRTYSLVFDPHAAPEEDPILHSLADDLADVYRDLQLGNLLWEDGRQAEAAWQWRFHWSSHWGRHATGALYALHTYRW